MRQTVSLLLLALLALPALGEVLPRKARYAEATCVYSLDPTKAVLTISASGNSSSRQTVIVFGDGRLELSDNRRGKWVGQISRQEMDELIDLAVSHGLAEWDNATLRAWQLADFGPFPGKVDGVSFRVILALDRYQRGGYVHENLERLALVRSPSFVAEHFPDIPQFHAVAELANWMVAQVDRAAELEP